MSVDLNQKIGEWLAAPAPTYEQIQREDAIRDIIKCALHWYNNYCKVSDEDLDSDLEEAVEYFEKIFSPQDVQEFLDNA